MPNTTIIYHNPNCGTSRNTLAILKHAGLDPIVIEYLKTPPSKEVLIKLLSNMNMQPRDLLRIKGTPYHELHLDDFSLSNDQLLSAMLEHPILINRPIVITELGTKLCRPSEVVFKIFPSTQIKPFTKEDGEAVIDNGVRESVKVN